MEIFTKEGENLKISTEMVQLISVEEIKREITNLLEQKERFLEELDNQIAIYERRLQGASDVGIDLKD